jgi:threonine/homoserine/homoserine lactone efflux protein
MDYINSVEIGFFLHGLILGFVIAAPVGPIGLLCIRRSLNHGRRAGLASGMGAATADSIYGFIAAFGLTYISDALSQHEFLFRILGAGLLCFLGAKTFIAKPEQRCPTGLPGKRYAGMYTSTFFLTLTNPMTIFSFAAVFAGFGLGDAGGSLVSAATLILGVFLGSGLWWLLLVLIFSIFKGRLNHHQLQWVNWIAGSIITGSGILALLTMKW